MNVPIADDAAGLLVGLEPPVMALTATRSDARAVDEVRTRVEPGASLLHDLEQLRAEAGASRARAATDRARAVADRANAARARARLEVELRSSHVE